ncbi:MAG TPA: universal stress protein [Actinomycetota bacterium]|nr:universal stress protein [Actinomycetota bacterium]
MAYRRIMVATDGSETANTALEKAARVASRCATELLIATAFQPPNYDKDIAQEVLDYSREATRRFGVEAQTEMQRGEPADVIIEIAQRRRADCIVIGNQGMEKVRRFRLGSLPEQVAHYAPCDLLIVNTSAQPDSAEDGPLVYPRMLVGTDGSPTATEAVRKAFELALLLRSAVTLMYVGDKVVGSIVLDDAARTLRLGRTKCETRVEKGDPADALTRVGDREGFGLVVVGNKGMQGPRRYLLGSVPNKVAHKTPTDVLIVKTVGRSVEDLAPGHGGVVDANGQKVAAYKDESGAIIALSPRCQHMGCTVNWNDADKTWDCPCHGSRYALEGEVIQGPATKALAKLELSGR